MSRNLNFPEINYKGDEDKIKDNATELLNEAVDEQLAQHPNFILQDSSKQEKKEQVVTPSEVVQQVPQSTNESFTNSEHGTYVDQFSPNNQEQPKQQESFARQSPPIQEPVQQRSQRVDMNAHQSQVNGHKKSKDTQTRKVFLTAFMGTLAALMLFVGGTQIVKVFTGGNGLNRGAANTSGSLIQEFGNSLDVSGVVDAVAPGIVTVHVKKQSATIFGSIQEAEGQGSGVVYHREDGKIYILTNAHVIQDATSVGVYRNDLGKGAIDHAKVLNYDTESDVAVLVLENPSNEYNVTIDFGNSDELKLGEQVIAVGSPLGEEFSGSVTGGIISGLNRQIPLDNWGTKYSTFIQTDAAINGGNSGGGLIDMQGRLIGINSAKINSADNIGLAIPSNIVLAVMEKMNVPMPDVNWELEKVVQQ